MRHQYYAQRRAGGHNPHGRGTINPGTIVYLQDGIRPMAGLTRPAVRRVPWQVEGWTPRDYCTSTGTTRMAGGHLATVRSLADRRQVRTVADWLLLACIDAGLERN